MFWLRNVWYSYENTVLWITLHLLQAWPLSLLCNCTCSGTNQHLIEVSVIYQTFVMSFSCFIRYFHTSLCSQRHLLLVIDIVWPGFTIKMLRATQNCQHLNEHTKHTLLGEVSVNGKNVLSIYILTQFFFIIFMANFPFEIHWCDTFEGEGVWESVCFVHTKWRLWTAL